MTNFLKQHRTAFIIILILLSPPNKPCQKSRNIFSVGRFEKGTDLILLFRTQFYRIRF